MNAGLTKNMAKYSGKKLHSYLPKILQKHMPFRIAKIRYVRASDRIMMSRNIFYDIINVQISECKRVIEIAEMTGMITLIDNLSGNPMLRREIR